MLFFWGFVELFKTVVEREQEFLVQVLHISTGLLNLSFKLVQADSYMLRPRRIAPLTSLLKSWPPTVSSMP